MKGEDFFKVVVVMVIWVLGTGRFFLFIYFLSVSVPVAEGLAA